MVAVDPAERIAPPLGPDSGAALHSAPDGDGFHQYLPLAVVAAELPCRRGGRRTATQTLYRWTSTGCRGVKLRYVQIGSTRCTTRAWLHEFVEQLTSLSKAAAPAD